MSGAKADPFAGLPDPGVVIADMARRNPVFQGMGIEVLLAERGLSRFAMIVRPDMGNTFGVCHGGVYFTLADLCLGFTCNAARNERAVTASASIEYLSPAKVGDRMLAEAREIYREGRTGFYDVRLWVEGGETVALVRGRMRILGEPVMSV